MKEEQTQQIIKDRARAEVLINDFNYMRNMAELKALSNYSLKNPLNDIQFKKMMELKKELRL